MNFTQGEIIYINKPYRMSSFGALAFVRTRISKKIGVRRVKIGHAGTLDPLATGVLVLCTGKMTKEIDEVDETYPVNHITEDGIRQALGGFVGEIQQVPPQYSAVKIGGKRAYELKRKGNEVALASKPVRIDEIELTAYDAASKQATIRVVCGKGTYIRSLARDIGEALQSGAYLTSLCRTRVGTVRIEECISIDDFSAWLDQQDIEMS